MMKRRLCWRGNERHMNIDFGEFMEGKRRMPTLTGCSSHCLSRVVVVLPLSTTATVAHLSGKKSEIHV